MEIIRHKKDLQKLLLEKRGKNELLGFVPTMGALHPGHLSLIEQSQKRCEITVCSIFVNPTQFNDPKDLERYPRPIEKDIALLEQAGCDMLFLPEVEEMYDSEEKWHMDLGYLETILEAAHRPGHFQGVTQIVKKLLDAVAPDIAFFGQKDYQQVLVVKALVKTFHIPTHIEVCPIVRESDGLAMSSRNVHLSSTEREASLLLSKALFQIQTEHKSKKTAVSTETAKHLLSSSPLVQLEYLSICDADTLREASALSDRKVALVAAKVGATRLIDNILLD